MRIVRPSSEIAHLWMHKAQPEARTSTGHFYFLGDTIYSYGSHFPIARHVTGTRGRAGVLLTTKHYSVTTSGHVDRVSRAIHGNPVQVLHTPTSIGGPAVRLAKDSLKEFATHIESAAKECFGPSGRFRPLKWRALGVLVAQANEFAEFFGSKRQWDMPETPDSVREAIARAEAKALRAEQAARRKYEKAEAERESEYAANLQRWINGEPVDPWALRRHGPASLRVNGDEVETSLGASVSLVDARRGLAFVRKVRASGTPYRRNSHTLRLGHYPIDSVDAEGNLEAGCHTITFAEIERIAPEVEAQMKIVGTRRANIHEAEQHAAFEQMLGVDRATRLLNLYMTSFKCGTEYDFLMGYGKTKEQVFISKAKNEHFTDREIRAFLALQ